MDRDTMIELLVDDDINTIFTAKEQYNDEELVASIIQYGFRGYEDFTDGELLVEVRQRELMEMCG